MFRYVEPRNSHACFEKKTKSGNLPVPEPTAMRDVIPSRVVDLKTRKHNLTGETRISLWSDAQHSRG